MPFINNRLSNGTQPPTATPTPLTPLSPNTTLELTRINSRLTRITQNLHNELQRIFEIREDIMTILSRNTQTLPIRRLRTDRSPSPRPRDLQNYDIPARANNQLYEIPDRLLTPHSPPPNLQNNLQINRSPPTLPPR